MDLRHQWLHYSRPFRRFHKQNWHVIRQYAIVSIIMTGVFLPVRLVFYTYVSHNWLGNLGMMSLIALTMFILVEKNKLGWFGVYFKNRVRRFVFHKIFWVGVLFALLNTPFWALILWEIDKGEFLYVEEREKITGMMIYKLTTDNLINKSLSEVFFNTNMPVTDNYYDDVKTLNSSLPLPVKFADEVSGRAEKNVVEMLYELNMYPSSETMIWVATTNQTDKEQWIESWIEKGDLYFIDSTISITAFMLNVMITDAWGSHFLIVFLLGDLEAVGLLFFYRKAYFKKDGVPWHEIDMFPTNIRDNLKRSHVKWKLNRNKIYNMIKTMFNKLYGIP